MSSFRRKSAPKAANTSKNPGAHADEGISAVLNTTASLGVKPCIHNSLGLVSSGHSQLDEILGGGLQLGTCFLVGSDIHSNYADTLVAYGLAEGLSMKQKCLLLSASRPAAEALLAVLPYNRILGEDASKKSKSHFCCSYDLSRPMQPTLLESDYLQVHCGAHSHGTQSGNIQERNHAESQSGPPFLKTMSQGLTVLQSALDSYVRATVDFVKELEGSGGVGRVFLSGFHEILAILSTHVGGKAAVSASQTFELGLSLVQRLKIACRSSKVSLVISVAPEGLPGSQACAIGELGSNSTDGGTSVRVIHPLLLQADSAVMIDSFAGKQDLVPYEFAEFCGFLVVERTQHLGTLVPHRPKALRFGLKRDRRKLHIEPLHLPPEESRAQGNAGTDARLEMRSLGRVEALNGGKQETTAPLVPKSGFKLVGDEEKNAYSKEKIDESDHKPTGVITAPEAGAGGVHLHPSEVESGEAATTSGLRPYKRLNFGQKPEGQKVGGAVSISTFRKSGNSSKPKPALAPGVGCAASGPRKDHDLDF